jgi:fructose-1,6-bisphosphatase II
MNDYLPPDLGFDLVRSTEEAALQAGRWKGAGQPKEADWAATNALYQTLRQVDIKGKLVHSDCSTDLNPDMVCGANVGSGEGPQVDVVCDSIDGRQQLSKGQSGALSAIAVAPAGSIWKPSGTSYMYKLVVNHEAASALVPECLDAPAAWTLALVARAKRKSVNDLIVFILDRPRHHDLITEIRNAGARVMLRQDGDIAGALMASMPENDVDILMGIGGILEGVLAACAVKSLGGGMIGRLAPQNEAEVESCQAAGQDTKQILNCDELVRSSDVYVAATGITSGPLLSGIRYHGNRARSNSLILRGRTMTRREMRAEHLIREDRGL